MSETWQIAAGARLDGRVAVVRTNGPVVALVDSHKDARLIAAVPELLEAVRRLLGSIEPEHHGHADQVEAREMARAAIAKAVPK